MIKPFLSCEQQIVLLSEQKNLIIANQEHAMCLLTDIGYFSLIGGYKAPFINPMTRKYEGGTTIEDIAALYQFDKALRALTFNYLGTVEQKAKQLLANVFCARFGALQTAYLDANNYSQRVADRKKVSDLIRILDNLANQNTAHQYILHQRTAHQNVPLWVLTKALTFGQVSKMYALLQPQQRRMIAAYYKNVSESQLGSFLSCLTYFRNASAHNERLFSLRLQQHDFPDTPMHQKLGIPQIGCQYTMGKNDYFGVVIAFKYLLRGTEFRAYKRQLKAIMSKYLRASHRISQPHLLSMMGFPENWENISKYRV